MRENTPLEDLSKLIGLTVIAALFLGIPLLVASCAGDSEQEVRLRGYSQVSQTDCFSTPYRSRVCKFYDTVDNNVCYTVGYSNGISCVPQHTK